MTNKFKNYCEYRRNRKIAKRELTKLAATAFPVINETAAKAVSNAGRLIEILSYLSQLTPEEIQTILGHSIVETNKTIQK